MLDAAGGPVFLLLALVIVAAAVLVVSLKNIFHCALCLILCLSGIAGIYILLHAEFLAAAQLLIYVGAVSILIIFAIMLTSNLATQRIRQINQNAMAAFFICLLFVFGFWVMLGRTAFRHQAVQSLPENNAGTIGALLMTDFMLPFEIISILLLAALIGAIVLARGERT